MSRITVSAIVATSHSITKYPGWEMPPGVLEKMAESLRKGELPMLFDHDATQPLDGRVIDARVVETDDGHQAVQVDFDIDSAQWNAVKERFAEAGVPGGMSFRATAFETPPSSGESAKVTLAVDAGAWSEADRATAVATLDEITPTEGVLLFEFSGVELAAVVIVLHNVGLGVLGNAAYDAIKHLVRSRRRGEGTRIEIKRRDADGGETAAVIETDDPDVAIEALRRLDSAPEAPLLKYENKERRWIER